MIKVRRNGKEIFNAGGSSISLNFPSNTRLDCIEQDGFTLTVVLKDAPPDLQGDAVIMAERELIRRGHLIAAIKCYRERVGLGLKDAKDAVERERAAMIARGEYFPEVR